MPLIELSTPAGFLDASRKEELRNNLATAVLNAMDLPLNDFFYSATWVTFSEFSPEDLGSGNGGADNRVLAVITGLAGFLDGERNEALGAEITELVQKAAGSDSSATVWTITHEVPEGNWSVNGQLTRRAKIDAMVAAARKPG